jgi:arylsulfatase A-like enzyme
LACLLAGLCGCNRATQETDLTADRGVSRPPVVLVSVDTLRSDYLRLYNPEEGVATPALESLRADGSLYTHAYSPMPMTLPAHVTALTGLLPARHGVRDNGGFRFDAPGHPYLPRRLAEAGYATGAFVSSFVLRGNSGMADGFEVYDDNLETSDDSPFGTLQRPGAETLRRALDWVAGVRDRPFFLFLHLYEPHLPYSAPPAFADRFDDPYKAEIAYVDTLLAELLSELKQWQLYDPSLIVFMSDHGEGLGDHDYQEHGLLLYREALQVPLIVKAPGSSPTHRENAGSTVDGPVQLADLPPSIERWIGLDVTASTDGAPLQDAGAATARSLFAETFVPRLHYGWSELGSVIQFPYHLIWGPDPELYDLEQDPAQLNDLFDARQDVVRRLARARQEYDWTVPRPAAEDAETLANLEALGYLAGADAAETGDASIDPKSRLAFIGRMNRATSRFRRGERDEAVAEFRAIVREAPEIVAAWEGLGKSLLQMGRPREAVEALEEAMRRSHGRPLIALALANAHWRAGDLEAARRHAEIAAATQDLAHGLLAQIAVRQGDTEAALHHLARAVELPPIRDQALLTRAELELAAAPEAALTTLGEVADVTLPAFELVRGRALAALDRADEAEAAFRRQIERHPDVLDGYTYLAYFYSLRGDGSAVGATLQAMVAANETPPAYAAAVNTLRLVGDAASAERLLEVALRRWPRAPALARLASGS